ncbi:MAG: cell division protein FtsZ [Burkholderiales bacterium]
MILSDLTLYLIALGGVFIAGLSIHSIWQARKTAPRQSSLCPVLHREPVFHSPGVSAPVPVNSAPVAPVQHTPHTEKTLMAQDAPTNIDSFPDEKLSFQAQTQPFCEASGLHLEQHPVESAVVHPDAIAATQQLQLAGLKTPHFIPQIDALIDAIVPIHLESPITGEVLQNHMPSSRHAGTKPFFIEALNERTRDWEYPLAGQCYTELQGAIQLANRHGALNELEYSEFVQKMEALSLFLGGTADFPDMLDVVACARELDDFASQHDAQLTVHLRARNTAWSLGYVQQCAAHCGFIDDVTGRMVLASSQAGAPPVLTIQFDAQAATAEDPNQAALRIVTIYFDVPQTEPLAQPFEQWYQCARTLAETMDATLVDDYGRGLHDEGLASIQKELQRLYAALEEHGVPAGSMAARRLFS